MRTARKVKVLFLYLIFIIQSAYYKYNNKSRYNLIYYNIRNWGDLINPVLASKFTKNLRLIDIDMRNRYLNDDDIQVEFMMIGSILQHASSKTIVWGAGLISDSTLLREEPLDIISVRGPLTRQVLLNQGIKCPDVYGDPALLLPFFFKNKYKKKFKLGIVPHNDHEKYPIPEHLVRDNEIKIISLRNSFEVVLESILSCESIVSSSLHGLIVAEAYGIPTRRISFGKELRGGDFKFKDHYLSIGSSLEPSISVNHDISKNDLIESCTLKNIKLDLNELLEKCPFNK